MMRFPGAVLRRHVLRLVLSLLLSGAALPAWAARSADLVDRIVAVVDDQVILDSELQERMEEFKRELRQNGAQTPPDSLLAPQVLESMIVNTLQIQLAEKFGVKIDDDMLREQMERLAQQNRMGLDDFRQALRAQGLDYAEFAEKMRRKLMVETMQSQVVRQIKVSEREIDQYLEEHNGPNGGGDAEYLLGHILIATPRAASPADVQKAREKAEKLLAQIKQGLDFRQAAMGSSNDELALKGGDLGWRGKGMIPTLFADLVGHMKEGDVEGPIHNSSGFHLIKLLGVRGGGGGDAPVLKTRARHILIKTSEVLSDDEARQKVQALKKRIESGEDFSKLAQAYSDDKGSAVKGGELGWVQPDMLVPAFAQAMSKLTVNELSEPVQTQYGWHLIQVLERGENQSSQEKREQAQRMIQIRKAEEEIKQWLRNLRDEAYVEVRLKD